MKPGECSTLKLFDVMPEHTSIVITQDMLDYAEKHVEKVRVHRTAASGIDTLVGLLGELAFAQWYLGDWCKHDVLSTKGKVDFFDAIEIKTSAYPYTKQLNLLVREDYAMKRKPAYYVQVILNVASRKATSIPVGTHAILAGCATSEAVDQAPLRDFGSKWGRPGGYRCHYISIAKLDPIEVIGSRES